MLFWGPRFEGPPAAEEEAAAAEEEAAAAVLLLVAVESSCMLLPLSGLSLFSLSAAAAAAAAAAPAPAALLPFPALVDGAAALALSAGAARLRRSLIAEERESRGERWGGAAGESERTSTVSAAHRVRKSECSPEGKDRHTQRRASDADRDERSDLERFWSSCYRQALGAVK